MKKVLPFIWIGLLFLVFSCREDDPFSSHEAHESNIFQRKVVDFAELKSKLAQNSKSLQLLSGKANKGEDDYILEIDSTYIVEYSNMLLTTYTMRVSTVDDGNHLFSNLIIRVTDGGTEEFIAHYSPTDEWMSAHALGEYLPYEGDEELVNIDGEPLEVSGKGKITCSYSIFPIWECDAGNNHPPGHPNCTEGGSEIVGYTYDIDCSSDNGGGGDSGDDDEPDDPFDNDGQGGLPTDPIPGGGGNGNQTPCQALRNKLNEPLVNNKSFKTRIQELKDSYNSPGGYEYGFVNQNPKEKDTINPPTHTNQYNPTVSTAPHKTRSPFLSKRQTFGYAHTHPVGENSAAIHSFPDLKIFIQMVYRRFQSGLSTDDTYGIVVGEHGVYSLKMNNITTFASFFLGGTPQEKKKFWENFQKQYDELITNGTDNTRTGNEEAMAKLLKKFGDKLGIGLYRAKDDFSGWNQLQLGSHGSGVLSTPCN